MTHRTADVWLVELDGEDTTGRAVDLLPAAEVDRLALVVGPHREHRFRAQAALRVLVARATGHTPRAVPLERGPRGKPALAGGAGPHVSLAHSGAFAAVALTAAGPVGVDIEQPRPVPDAAGLARTVMSTREFDRWRGQPAATATDALLRAWTWKEAVLKALGVGLAGDVRAVTARYGEGQPVIETLPPDAGPAARWTLRDLSDSWGLPAAVAVAAPEVRVFVHRTGIGELLAPRSAVATAGAQGRPHGRSDGRPGGGTPTTREASLP